MKTLLSFFILFFTICVSAQSNQNDSDKKYSIGINFSPDYSFRKLSAENDDLGLVEKLNKMESPKLGFTGGLVSLYRFNERFVIETGIQLSDKGERHEESNLTWVTPDDDIYTVNDPAIPSSFKINYKYYYLGVPLKLNFYLIRRKLNLFIVAGGAVDFLMKAKIRSTLEFQDRKETHTSTQDEDYFNKVNFVGLAGFGIDYKISQRFQLRFEPIFRYSFTPVVDSDLKENLYSAGANVAILFN
jgi:hypothetical protein